MAEDIHITITPKHNGVLLSTIYGNFYYKRLYIGGDWEEAEAREDFAEYVKAEDAKIFRNVPA